MYTMDDHDKQISRRRVRNTNTIASHIVTQIHILCAVRCILNTNAHILYTKQHTQQSLVRSSAYCRTRYVSLRPVVFVVL